MLTRPYWTNRGFGKARKYENDDQLSNVEVAVETQVQSCLVVECHSGTLKFQQQGDSVWWLWMTENSYEEFRRKLWINDGAGKCKAQKHHQKVSKPHLKEDLNLYTKRPQKQSRNWEVFETSKVSFRNETCIVADVVGRWRKNDKVTNEIVQESPLLFVTQKWNSINFICRSWSADERWVMMGISCDFWLLNFQNHLKISRHVLLFQSVIYDSIFIAT